MSANNVSSVTLSVTNGEFYECKATSDRGGGIYCQGIGKVTVKTSFFSWCTCKANSDLGGGGIGVYDIQTQPHIECCDFVHCSSGNDGGGISICYSYSHPDTLPITKCRFFCCYANSTANGDGGAIILWKNQEIFGLSNCLFSSGHSILRAGATSFGFGSMIQVSFSFICFSFFSGNTAPNGNDICLYNVKGNPILHSFTTIDVNTLYNSTSECFIVDWLPLGTFFFLNLREMISNSHKHTSDD